VGPRPFETDDRPVFFGREREADDLLSLVMFHRIVLLYAQSGAGKSSLINTSIVPGLVQAQFSALPIARVRGAPSAKSGSVPNIYAFNVVSSIAPEALLETSPALRLANAIEAAAPSWRESSPVLILDQFEELFTTDQDRWSEREGFFAQIAEAQAEIHTLRILLSMREEFIAELDPLIWRVPQGIDARYRLELLRHDAAIAAVREPARLCGVVVERGAAEKLVGDLLQINVEGAGGEIRQVRGEYVEPVQLQIVCSRLWGNLPANVDVITEANLEQFGAAKEALAEFYATAVKEAAHASGYPEKLIHLGCTQFVTASGTRSMVHRQGDMVGLLPERVVKLLENAHLLRAELRAGGHWYEITHDRLIKPVLDRKLYDEEIKALLRTRDLLQAAVEQWKARRDFIADRHIIGALSEIKNELILSNDELEFLGMNSIGAGFETAAWVQRLMGQSPELLGDILLRASRHASARIRTNASAALRFADIPSANQALVALATEDSDMEVRKAAAVALIQADRPALNARMIALLGEPRARARAKAALAQMRNETEAHPCAANFERQWSSISLRDRTSLRLNLAWLRLHYGWPTILYVATLAGFFSGLACGLARMVPADLGLTLTNLGPGSDKPSSLFEGLFQGMAGGLAWGTMTAASIALGWILIRRFGPGSVNKRHVGNVLFGTVGGIAGGIGVFSEIFFVFSPASLESLHWVPSGAGRNLGACIGTGYCLFHPLLGVAFGGGMGVALSMLHRSTRWNQFLRPHIDARRIIGWTRTAKQILGLSAVYSLVTGLLLYASALALSHRYGFDVSRAVWETATILIGNIGGVAGVVFGQLIMRVGIIIPPRSD
jgi:hypothetical protein